METLLHIVAIGAALFSLLAALLLAFETAAGLFPPETHSLSRKASGQAAIIIPAHNEIGIIATTLANVKSQLHEGDRLIVVADNCSDDTSNVARSHGAECFERIDPARRGKGYALQFAIDQLRAAPPDIVVFIDADCLLGENALEKITSLAAGEETPVQALYLMQAPKESSARLKAAEFAWLFMNKIRMSGLQRLFGVTRFTGSGLAAPWAAVSEINFASGEIVEDLALTFELTKRGFSPILEPEATVISEFPSAEDALSRQSARWSIGSMALAVRRGGAWMIEACARQDAKLFAAAADLFIPPLTIFIAWLFIVTLLACLSWLLGSVAAIKLSFAAIVLTIVSVLAGWIVFGRKVLPLSELPGIYRFLIAKLAVFGSKGWESAKSWTPTRKTDHDDAAN